MIYQQKIFFKCKLWNGTCWRCINSWKIKFKICEDDEKKFKTCNSQQTPLKRSKKMVKWDTYWHCSITVILYQKRHRIKILTVIKKPPWKFDEKAVWNSITESCVVRKGGGRVTRWSRKQREREKEVKKPSKKKKQAKYKNK